MGFWETYGAVVLGIVLSVLGPILRQALPKPKEERTRGEFWKEYGENVKPFLALGVFSVLTALLVVAILGDTLGQDWRTALVAGYAWDSTLQKAKG